MVDVGTPSYDVSMARVKARKGWRTLGNLRVIHHAANILKGRSVQAWPTEDIVIKFECWDCVEADWFYDTMRALHPDIPENKYFATWMSWDKLGTEL